MKGGEGENCEANLGEECFRQWKQCKGPEAGGCLVSFRGGGKPVWLEQSQGAGDSGQERWTLCLRGS